MAEMYSRPGSDIKFKLGKKSKVERLSEAKK